MRARDLGQLPAQPRHHLVGGDLAFGKGFSETKMKPLLVARPR